jgi:hypothetical protein
MAYNSRQLRYTNLHCTQCGHVNNFYRISGRWHGEYHIKHMWCIKCKERVAHLEINEPMTLEKADRLKSMGYKVEFDGEKPITTKENYISKEVYC